MVRIEEQKREVERRMDASKSFGNLNHLARQDSAQIRGLACSVPIILHDEDGEE